jgi:membrane protein YdbS with pleckstrin-like domain
LLILIKNKSMLQKDKIKIIVVLTLIIAMGITYFFEGKESFVMKIVAGLSLVIWLVTLVLLNKKYN